MKTKCQGCGIEKDPTILEIYPYQEEDSICDDPIPPLFGFECQPGGHTHGGFKVGPYRKILVCHECFHKLSPDMWISQSCWESLNPVVPFDQLESAD